MASACFPTAFALSFFIFFISFIISTVVFTIESNIIKETVGELLVNRTSYFMGVLLEHAGVPPLLKMHILELYWIINYTRHQTTSATDIIISYLA